MGVSAQPATQVYRAESDHHPCRACLLCASRRCLGLRRGEAFTTLAPTKPCIFRPSRTPMRDKYSGGSGNRCRPVYAVDLAVDREKALLSCVV